MMLNGEECTIDRMINSLPVLICYLDVSDAVSSVEPLPEQEAGEDAVAEVLVSTQNTSITRGHGKNTAEDCNQRETM